MKSKHIYYTLAAISLICIIFSTIIYVENIQLATSQQDFCSAITGSNGCATVQTSNYSKTLGISNSIYGIAGFTLLTAILIMLAHKERKILRYLAILGMIIAGIVAAYFIYLQAFVLHTYCIFCMVVDVSSLIMVGILIYSSLAGKYIGKHK